MAEDSAPDQRKSDKLSSGNQQPRSGCHQTMMAVTQAIPVRRSSLTCTFQPPDADRTRDFILSQPWTSTLARTLTPKENFRVQKRAGHTCNPLLRPVHIGLPENESLSTRRISNASSSSVEPRKTQIQQSKEVVSFMTSNAPKKYLPGQSLSLSLPQAGTYDVSTQHKHTYRNLSSSQGPQVSSVSEGIGEDRLPEPRPLVDQTSCPLMNINTIAMKRPIGLHCSETRGYQPHHSDLDCKRAKEDVETDSVEGARLAQLLETFPMPPIKGISEKATGPLQYISTDTQRSELLKPQNPLLMTAEVIATPEFDTIDFGREQSMLIALDIRASLPYIKHHKYASDHDAALIISIIVDNSIETSPTALMTFCETTRYLCSLLDADCDSFGILKTCACGTRVDAHEVLPLTFVKQKVLKSALDSILIPTANSRQLNVGEALVLAQRQLLEHTETASHVTRSGRILSSHIFLFSASVDESFRHICLDSYLTLHLISPNSIPFKQEPWLKSNGWKIQSTDDAVCLRTDNKWAPWHATDVSQSLKRLVTHARKGCTAGYLANCKLFLDAGPHCIIEEVIGSRRLRRLQLGEVHTVIVRIRTKQDYPGQPRPQVTDTELMKHGDIYAELTRILFETDKVLLLKATMSYFHPYIQKTVCATSVRCQVYPNAVLPINEISTRSDLELKSPSRRLIHQRMAARYLGFPSLSDGLSELLKSLQTNLDCVACPEYIKLLASEQSYRARIQRRRDMENSPQKSRDYDQNAVLQLRDIKPRPSPQISSAASTRHEMPELPFDSKSLSAFSPRMSLNSMASIEREAPSGLQISVTCGGADQKLSAGIHCGTKNAHQNSIRDDLLRNISTSSSTLYGLSTSPWSV